MTKWQREVWRCVKVLQKAVFSLGDVYLFEQELQRLFPRNHHIKDAIRKTLQELRDMRYLEFIDDHAKALSLCVREHKML